jgi:mono/diheme cytochrome c family protein
MPLKTMKQLLASLALASLFASYAHAQDATDIKASAERGKATYMMTCLACHQITGQGVPGTFPPFDGSEYVQGDPKRLVAIVIKGLTGPITVKGTKFPGVIPLIAVDTQFPQLKDNAKLADVLNFIRTSWSNKADVAITPEFIQKVRDEFATRTTPWTEAEVQAAFPTAK